MLYPLYLQWGGDLWLSGGQNLNNTRSQDSEDKIGPDNVGDLAVKWVFETRPGGDVSATPAVDGRAVYFPAWDGYLYKVDKKTGEEIWSFPIADYTGVPFDFARTTPAVHENMLIFGDQGGQLGGGASVMAVSKKSGDLIWVTKVDAHPAAVITQSAVIHKGIAYVGISSVEENFAADPNYPCCSFRGSVLALDAGTGAILWQTFTTPDQDGYSGNSVWGSTPVVDKKRNSLYVTTGNNYTVPQSVLDCVADNEGDPAAIEACDPSLSENLFDAFVALDLDTGVVKWHNTVIPFDAWTVACLFGVGTCPDPAGPDHDFGQGPILYTIMEEPGKPRDLLGAGQKSGQYWALDPDTGETVWVTQVGPGGELGGLQWGSAYDGERIYTATSNSNFAPWDITNPPSDSPVGVCVDETAPPFSCAGMWSALNPATGEILWQTADPNFFMDQAAVSVANGVVYVGSLAPDPAAETFFGLDAETGERLWGFNSGASVNAGAAIVNGNVYWGSGYGAFSAFLGTTGNNKLYAFEIPK